MRHWTVRPDRAVTIADGVPFFMQADGPHHWTDTARKNDDWQDRMLLKRGLAKAILRVDSPLLETKRYWPGVWEAMVAMACGDYTTKRLNR